MCTLSSSMRVEGISCGLPYWLVQKKNEKKKVHPDWFLSTKWLKLLARQWAGPGLVQAQKFFCSDERISFLGCFDCSSKERVIIASPNCF